MKILLIGNGFDLAHNLPTSYTDFLQFCQKTRQIYSSSERVQLSQYVHDSLDDWNINSQIKDILKDTFKTRTCKRILHEDGSHSTKVTTANNALNELYTLIEENTWLKYFIGQTETMGKNWIDFESEISKVIQALDSARFQLECGGSVNGTEKNEQTILINIVKNSKEGSLKSSYQDIEGIDRFTNHLNTDLERLIRALEIWFFSKTW